MPLKEKSYYKFGITQGRLTPSKELQKFPSEEWQLEFINASKIGISFIELLSEREFNPNNPLWSKEGRVEIKKLCKNNKLELYSIVCDFSINYSLLDKFLNNSLNHYDNLLFAASEIGCNIVVLPLVGKSHINYNNMLEFENLIKCLSDKAKNYDIIICLETLLTSTHLVRLLNKINKDNIKVVLDTGNIASSNNCLYSEVKILHKYLKHIHIKDKDSNDNNVYLGTGLVNFKDLFLGLKEINYLGPLVFETTRGSDPLNTAKDNINMCNYFTNKVK